MNWGSSIKIGRTIAANEKPKSDTPLKNELVSFVSEYFGRERLTQPKKSAMAGLIVML